MTMTVSVSLFETTPLRYIRLIINSDGFHTILIFISKRALLIAVSLVTISSWLCTVFGLRTADLLRVTSSPSTKILCYPAFSPP